MKFMEAKASEKTKVVLDFEEKELTAKIFTDEVCLVGELNDEEMFKNN